MKSVAIKEKSRAITSRKTLGKKGCITCLKNAAPQSAGAHSILARSRMQKKATIGPVDDKYERNADSVADKVMRMPDLKDDEELREEVTNIEAPVRVLRRVNKEEDDVEEELKEEADSEKIQRVAMDNTDSDEEKKEPEEATDADQVQRIKNEDAENKEEEEQANNIQRKAKNTNSLHLAFSNISSRITTPTGGRPLSFNLRSFMEPRFNHDFSNVRVHDNVSDRQDAAGIHARAFTYGNQIWIGKGESADNHRLMAHELTHVVQQRSAPKKISPKNDKSQNITKTRKSFVQRSIWDDITGSVGAFYDKAKGKVVDAAGRVIDMGADLFWKLIRKVAPSFEPVLRKIAKQGIVGFLVDKLKSAASFILSKLENKNGVIATLVKGYIELSMSVLDVVKGLASGNCDLIYDSVENMGEILKKTASQAWQAMKRFFIPIGGFFLKLWKSYGAPVMDWLKETAGDIWAYIKDLGMKIWKWTEPVREELGAAWDWIKDKLGIGDEKDSGPGIIDWVKEKASEAWAFVKRDLQASMQLVMTLGKKIKALLPMKQIRNLRQRVQKWLNRVGAMASKMGKANGVLDEQISLRDEILPAVLKHIRRLRRSLIGAGQWIATQIGSVADSVKGLIAEVSGNPILGAAAGAIRWLEDGLNELVNWAQNTVVKLFKNLGNGLVYLSKFVDPVLDVLTTVAQVVGDVAKFLPKLIFGPFWLLTPKCIREPVKKFVIDTILKQIPIFAQLMKIPNIWDKVKIIALNILKKVFVNGDLPGALWTFFCSILRVLNVPPELITDILGKAAKVFGDLLNDPIGFMINLLKAIRRGFELFFDNIWQHLLGGVVGWLFKEIRAAGLTPPTDFSFKSILLFIMQIIDLTVERVFARIEKKIGPEKTAKIRKAFGIISDVWSMIKILINEGPAGLWEELKQRLGNLWDAVLKGVIAWVNREFVKKAIAKIVKMLDPTGIMAVVNSIIAIYKSIQSFFEYLREMLMVVNSVLDGIAGIISGAIDKAAGFLERSLASAVPIVIGFLANQFGLRNFGKRVGEMVIAVRERVNKAIDWVIEKVFAVGKAFIGGIKGAGKSVKDFLFKKFSFNAAGKTHTLMVEKRGEKDEVVVASSPGQPISKYLYNLRATINKKISDKEEFNETIRLYEVALTTKKKAEDLLGREIKREEILKGDIASYKSKEINKMIEELSNIIKKIWKKMGVSDSLLPEEAEEADSYGKIGKKDKMHAHHLPQNAIMRRLQEWVIPYILRRRKRGQGKAAEKMLEGLGMDFKNIMGYNKDTGIAFHMQKERHHQTRTWHKLPEKLDIERTEDAGKSIEEQVAEMNATDDRMKKFKKSVRFEFNEDKEDILFIYSGKRRLPAVKSKDIQKVKNVVRDAIDLNAVVWGRFLDISRP